MQSKRVSLSTFWKQILYLFFTQQFYNLESVKKEWFLTTENETLKKIPSVSLKL